MPRKRELAALGVLNFFRAAPYATAELVLELAGQELKARKAERVEAEALVQQGKPAGIKVSVQPRRRRPATPPAQVQAPTVPGPVEQVGG